MTELSLILVTHNSGGWLKGFADSWQAAVTRIHGTAIPTIIADSGSTDGAPFEKFFPDARVIRCGNVGFGAAANAAFEHASTPWLLLCNPDLTFADDFLDKLARLPQLQNPKVGCIAPRLLNTDGTVQPSVGAFPTLAALFRDQFRPREWRKYIHPQPAAAQRIDWASGACLLLRRDALRPVNGFDQLFFLYVEEVDLQKRLAAAGWENWFCPDLAVTHHHPNAARPPRPQVQRYAARGMQRYFAKHGSFFAYWTYNKIALLTGRLSLAEALSSPHKALSHPTGP